MNNISNECSFKYIKNFKITNKKYHTVGTFPKSNRKITKRDKIDTP